MQIEINHIYKKLELILFQLVTKNIAHFHLGEPDVLK